MFKNRPWIVVIIYKRQRIPKGQYKMNNSKKLATYGTQDEEKQHYFT